MLHPDYIDGLSITVMFCDKVPCVDNGLSASRTVFLFLPKASTTVGVLNIGRPTKLVNITGMEH